MKLRILTFNWHEVYISLLAKTGHDFDVVQKWKGGVFGWIHKFRPIPPNCTLITEEDAKAGLEANAYDIAIAHNIDDILFTLHHPVHKVMIFHNKLSTEVALGGNSVNKEEYRGQLRQLFDLAKNVSLVFISQMKKDDWGFEGDIILPGIDLSEYSGWRGDCLKALRIGNLLKERDLMMGYTLQEKILKGIPSTVLGLNPSIEGSIIPDSWDHLREFMKSHRVYLNTTVDPHEDGYNLAMLEAMATGMPVVSIANTSSPLQDGVNGFISYDEEDLHARIKELFERKTLASSLGTKARETVGRRFPIDAFVKNWNRILQKSCMVPGAELPPTKKLNILMSYTSNPQTTAAYLEKALRKHHSVITYGPKLSDEVFKAWDLEKIRDRVKDHDIPYSTAAMDEVLQKVPQGWSPDLFLWIETGVWFPMELDKLSCTKACYLIDTHLNFETHLSIAKKFDVVFLAQRAYVDEFKKNGIEHVFWLPLGCDLEMHGQRNSEKLYDIGFVGSLNNPRRVELLNLLSSRFNVHYERCFLERMAEVFSASKIVFNQAVKDDLNMRVFEALCSGSLLLTDEAQGSGLDEMFEDKKHLVIYKNEDELFRLAEYYLKNETERERIAVEGMKEVLNGHTYEHRALSLIAAVSPYLKKVIERECASIVTDVRKEITTDVENFYEKYWKESHCISKIAKSNKRIILDGCFPEGITGRRILEIGVGGEGGLILELKDANDVYGLDVSESAKANCERFGLRVALFNADKERIPFGDNYFDIVFATEVFEHFSNPQFALEEIRRVLKDDGELFISTPAPFVHHWPRLFYPELFEKKAFKEFLMANKFELVQRGIGGENLYKNLSIEDELKAWSWYWLCRKVENDPVKLFNSGKYFWDQKDQSGIRIKPMEAIELFRASYHKSSNPEVCFYLMRALLYRCVNGDEKEFEELLGRLVRRIEAECPVTPQSVFQVLITYLEGKTLGLAIFKEDKFYQLLSLLYTLPGSRQYTDEIQEFMRREKLFQTDAQDQDETEIPCDDTGEPYSNPSDEPLEYYQQERREIEAMVPHSAKRILDVGCGAGVLGKRLLQGNAEEVIGIEFNPQAGSRAKKNLSNVLIGDVETMELPFEQGHFDCIILADILEHLKEPLALLMKLKCYLKNSGVIVASIPNVQYWYTFHMLSEGRWEYMDSGIFDRTHLRFFTKKEIETLFSQAGFEITGIGVNIDPKYNEFAATAPQELAIGRVTLHNLTPEELKDLFTIQYLVRVENIEAQKRELETAVHAGSPEEKVNELDRYLEEHPLDLEMLYTHAELCYSAGLKEKALESIGKVLLFDPSRESAELLKNKIVEHMSSAQNDMCAVQVLGQLTTPFLSKEDVVNLYSAYADEIGSDLFTPMKKDVHGKDDGGISHVDAEILYALIRRFKPKHMIEFSPNEGYSTAFIYKALEANGQPFTFATFDLKEYPLFPERMRMCGISPELIQGDALGTIPNYLKERGLEGKVEFCFIDSDHSYAFAEKYAHTLFPLMSKNCIYMIHDMCYKPANPEQFSHYGPIRASEICGTAIAPGEGRFLSEFLADKEESLIFSTHRLFGDCHENSPDLPRNMELIGLLTKTIRGFSLPKSAGRIGGSPRPPMSLVIIPRERLVP